ncbi:MAG: hypothetical protein AB8G86_30565, partial [Saprospiraceae bacterium]
MKNYRNWSSEVEDTKYSNNLDTCLRRRWSIRHIYKLFTLGLWLVLIQANFLVAQDLQVNIGGIAQGMDNFSVCGTAKQISLTIKNILTDTLTDVTVSIPLLTGFSYVNASLSGDAILLNAATPSFTIDTLFPNIQKSFAFDAIVNCDGITEINAGGNKNVTADFMYTGGTGTFSETSGNFDLVKPTLSFTNSTPASLSLALNETASITSILANTTEGSLDELTFFIKKPTQLTLTSVTINGNLLVPSSTSGDTSFYTISEGLIALANNGSNNGDANLFEENEAFTIIENYQLNDCTINPTAFVRGANYGCDGVTCEEVTSSTPLLINSINITSHNDTTICFGDAINLTATGGSDYLWQQLSGPSGTITNPNLSTNATLNTVGLMADATYQVIVSAGNCMDFLETTVTVLDELMVSNDTTLCINEAVDLTVLGGSANYIWKEIAAPNGVITNPNISTNATFNTGVLIDTKFYRAVDVNCDDSLEIVVTVVEPLTISNDTTICPEENVGLTAAGGSGDFIWRRLTGPEGTILDGNISTTSTVTTGMISVRRAFRVIDPICMDSVEVTVDRFTPIPINAGRDQTICSGMTINLVGESGFTNYSWQALTGGAILSGQTIAISPIETTEYELIADDANGCEVRDTVKIIILEGSNFNVTIDVPQSGIDKFSVCGPEKTVTVTVENLITDTITNIDANFNLLPGFFYLPGSLVGEV